MYNMVEKPNAFQASDITITAGKIFGVPRK
jgi:hypothetical protein